MDAAKLMCKEACDAGADAVKFQTYKAETIASKYSPSYWDTSEEPTTSQFELFKNLILSVRLNTDSLNNIAMKSVWNFYLHRLILNPQTILKI